MTQPLAQRQLGRALLRATPVAAAVATLWALPGAGIAQQSGATAADGAQVITVTGIRRGIESAIATKKNSDSIVESVSAEDIGKLPDVSVAESLARLPGVAAQRTAGRAQQVSVRGLGPDFSTGLLNGREQVSTGDSRGVDFDVFPGELLSGVDVLKTPDAGLLGQGLSATINLKTWRPLDMRGRAVNIGYREGKTGYGLPGEKGKQDRITLSYIDQFADRTIGVALGYARFKEDVPAVQRFEAWGVADATFNNQTLRAPGGFNAFTDTRGAKREGLAATLEWRPNKTFRTSVDFFQSKFDNTKLVQGFQAPILFQSAGGYDPGDGVFTATSISNNVATAGSITRFKGVVRIDSEAIKDQLDSFGWNSQLKMGNWTGTLDLSQSKAKKRGGIVETTAGLPGNGNTTGQTDTLSWTGFDGNNLLSARYTTGVNYTDRNVVRLTDVQGWGGNINNGASSTPQAGYSKLPQVDDELNAVRLSAKRDLPEGLFFSTLDVGVNYTDREKRRAYIEGRLTIGGDNNPFGAAAIPGSGTTVAGQTGIPIATWDPTGSVGPIYTVAPKFVRDIANKDWTVEEKVTTAYVKMDLDRELFGLPVRGNAGVQLVRTDQSSQAFSIDGGPCPNDVCRAGQVRQGTNYTDFLPSLNLVAELPGDQRLRLGLSRTLARPTINDMRASLGFGVDANGGGNGIPLLRGDAGNPNLKPFRANALDLAYEKYFGGNKGYFGVSVFHKELSTYILRINEVFDFTPFIGPNTPLPTTVPNGPTNPRIGLLNRPVNGSGGSLTGIELGAQFPLDMVTSALRGFGVGAAYGYTDSKVSLPATGFALDQINSATIPLPGLSKEVAQVFAYFERWGFSARVAVRKRSDFLGDITNIFGDRNLTYVKAETITDWQIGYEVQSGPIKGLSVLFQVLNNGNEPYIRYRDRPYTKAGEVENTQYGKTYLLGASFKF
jgi:iron complex outermembrane receptor protein